MASYLNFELIKKQSTYVDGGILQIIENLNNVAETDRVSNTTALEAVREGVVKLQAEVKGLKKISLMNLENEKKLKAERKGVIDDVSKLLRAMDSELALNLNGSAKFPEKSVNQDHTVSQENNEDDIDIKTLLNMPLPQLKL